MTVDDHHLAALALVELVARLDGADGMPARREELDALLDGVNVERVVLQLAGMVLAVAESAGFPLAVLLAVTRRDLLSADVPPNAA
jgi:hypothetical protein